MKAFIFDPLWDELITDGLLDKLKEADVELVIKKEIAPLASVRNYLKATKTEYCASTLTTSAGNSVLMTIRVFPV